jgi:prevent-host-death family protein
MTTVSIRELKNKLSEYIDRASRGEEIVVTRRGKAVATMSSAPKREETLEEKLERLRAAGLISGGSGKPKLPQRRYKLQGEGPSMSEMIIEDRR